MALKTTTTTTKLYLALSISKHIVGGLYFFLEKYLLYLLINVPTNFAKKLL